MALAIKHSRWAHLLFPLSWIATFMHLFTIEYFSGMELVRPFLIWMLFAGKDNKNHRLLRTVLKNSLPYLLIAALFLWVRFVYYPDVFQTSTPLNSFNLTMAEFQGAFVDTSLSFINTVIMDLLYSTLQVWSDSITKLEGFSLQRKIGLFSFISGMLLTLLFSLFYKIDKVDASRRVTPSSVILIGLLMFLAGAFPVWAIGKEISAGGWNVRFTLAPMFGACLMVAGLVVLFVRSDKQKWLFSFLLMFSVASQIWIVNLYTRDWKTQLDYYWQLYWRMPALQPGTAIFSFEYPSHFITHDLDATWALNVLYNYPMQDGLIPYMFITPERDNYFRMNFDFEQRFRNFIFQGNTSNIVAILHPSEGSCLRVLDDVYQHDPLFNDGHEKLIPLSDPSRIIANPEPVLPFADIFGSEPDHTWCYYFQKADLARQIHDWGGVIALYKQAQLAGYSPENGAEYLPLIEAYVQIGDWYDAYELTITARRLSLGTLKMMCSNWVRFGQLPSANMEYVDMVYNEFSCQ
jgi:hypothetical protein